ncbi:MAG: rhodanese-like domain-containing protein [Arhodomonas sp.]|nr:rhodanese-like domain-containing protein [Arhodomonas sp.]
MERLVEFATNHPLLVLGTVGVIAAIIANEIYLRIQARDAVDPDTATRLYNREDAVFVDVRDENAFVSAHLPGAINAPGTHLEQHRDRLERARGHPVIVYGNGGGLASTVQAIRGMGHEPVYQLRGGFPAWAENGLPTEGRG